MGIAEKNKVEVIYQESNRKVVLAEGDLTTMSESVDYLLISVLPRDYTPTPSSMVGALNKIGVDVAALAQNKAKSWMDEYPCWISQPISGQKFQRLLVYENGRDRRKTLEQVTYVFAAIAEFEKNLKTESSPCKVAVPLLCTGSGGVAHEEMLDELFFAAVHWGAMQFPFASISIVMYPDREALVQRFASLKQQYEHLEQLYATKIYKFYAAQCLSAGDEVLSAREQFAVRLYTSNYYTTINRILWANLQDSTEYKQHRPLFEAIDTALRKLPDYSQVVYRGEHNMSPERQSQHQQGKHVESLAYTSTAQYKGVFYYSNYRFDLTPLTGSAIETYSIFPSEREVLMKRRLSYLVEKVEQGSFYLYDIKEDHVNLER